MYRMNLADCDNSKPTGAEVSEKVGGIQWAAGEWVEEKVDCFCQLLTPFHAC